MMEISLNKYPAAFFYTVMDSIRLSSKLVTEWLNNYMFEGEPCEEGKIYRIVLY